MSALEVLVRIALIGGSAGVNLTGHLSEWISGILGLLTVIVTAELAVRPYGATVFDRLLLIAGGVVTTLIILGLVLNVTPWGITNETWNVAWAILSFLVLFWRRGTHTNFSLPNRPVNVISVSIVVAAAIIVGAGVLAIKGVAKSDAEQVLSFSLVSSNPTNVTVEISATSVSGSYRITASLKGKKKSIYTSKPFDISAGSGTENLKMQMPVKDKGVWVIDLEPAKGNKVIRELIVKVGT